LGQKGERVRGATAAPLQKKRKSRNQQPSETRLAMQRELGKIKKKGGGKASFKFVSIKRRKKERAEVTPSRRQGGPFEG